MKRNTIVMGILSAFAVVAISGAGSHTVSAQAAETPAPAPAPVTAAQTVQVQPGDTLDRIARSFDTTYVRLFNANTNITDPDKIYSGQTIRIPAADEQFADRPLPGDVPAPIRESTTSTVAPSAPARQQSRAQAAPKPAVAVNGSVWDALAQCESGGNWSINTGNGYYGGLQFSMSTWTGYGGTGSPANASREQQIAIAERVLGGQGWGAWPACSSKLGLR
jgi:LysM repeat protein